MELERLGLLLGQANEGCCFLNILLSGLWEQRSAGKLFSLTFYIDRFIDLGRGLLRQQFYHYYVNQDIDCGAPGFINTTSISFNDCSSRGSHTEQDCVWIQSRRKIIKEKHSRILLQGEKNIRKAKSASSWDYKK